jgi:hypothetical protein
MCRGEAAGLTNEAPGYPGETRRAPRPESRTLSSFNEALVGY